MSRTATVKILRSTAANILNAGTSLGVGELIFATDTREVFVGDVLNSKVLVGRAMVGTYAAMPAAGVKSRLYFATDRGWLMLDVGNRWAQLGYEERIVNGMSFIYDVNRSKWMGSARLTLGYVHMASSIPAKCIMSLSGSFPIYPGGYQSSNIAEWGYNIVTAINLQINTTAGGTKTVKHWSGSPTYGTISGYTFNMTGLDIATGINTIPVRIDFSTTTLVSTAVYINIFLEYAAVMW